MGMVMLIMVIVVLVQTIERIQSESHGIGECECRHSCIGRNRNRNRDGVWSSIEVIDIDIGHAHVDIDVDAISRRNGGSHSHSHLVFTLTTPRSLTDHLKTEPGLITTKELMMKGSCIRSPRDLTKSPTIQFARERGVLASCTRGNGSTGTLCLFGGRGRFRKVLWEDLGGKDFLLDDDEGFAVGEPRDDVRNGRIGEDAHESLWKDFSDARCM